MEEKILVIDDEMHIVELLKFNLEVNGYIVDYSLDSFEGYHKAKEFKPNLILLDWMLPNISGRDVLKKINIIGYSELISYINQELTLEDAKELIKKNSRNYAKRQFTWFKNDHEYIWYDLDKMTQDEIFSDILQRFNAL